MNKPMHFFTCSFILMTEKQDMRRTDLKTYNEKIIVNVVSLERSRVPVGFFLREKKT